MSTKISSLPAKTVFNDTDLVIVSTDNGSSYTSQKMTIAQLKTELGVAAQPKRYKALISQSGENAPTAIVLENTLGEVLSFSREDVGSYLITSTGIFTTNKTFVLCQQINGVDIRTDQSASTPDSVEFYHYNSAGVLMDGLINVSILIEVYE